MLSKLEGGVATAHTVASMRAACEVLRVSAGGVTAVSLRGRVPEGHRAVLPLLSAAERLAAEYGYVLNLRLDGQTFEARFVPRPTVETSQPA